MGKSAGMMPSPGPGGGTYATPNFSDPTNPNYVNPAGVAGRLQAQQAFMQNQPPPSSQLAAPPTTGGKGMGGGKSSGPMPNPSMAKMAPGGQNTLMSGQYGAPSQMMGTTPQPGAASLLGAAPSFYNQSQNAFQYGLGGQPAPGWQAANIQGGPLPGAGAGSTPPQPMPGAQQVPSGGYTVPKDPQYVDPTKVPVGGVGPAPPGPQLGGITSVPPSGFSIPSTPAGATGAPPAGVPAGGGVSTAPVNKDAIKSPDSLQTVASMLSGVPPTYNMRQIGSQYAPGTTISMRTGLPVGQTGAGPSPATQQAPQPQLGPGQFATNYFTPGMPTSVSVAQFNQAKQSNPALAYQMATHAGQDFRNAIAQQNGMSSDQFNQWLNNAAYNQGGLNYRFGG